MKIARNTICNESSEPLKVTRLVMNACTIADALVIVNRYVLSGRFCNDRPPLVINIYLAR